MTLDDVQRRSYLAGVAAAMTGLAGCGDVSGPGGSGGVASDQTAAGDGASEGGGDGDGSLAPTDIHGTVYASAMPGEDLSAKVRNAMDAMPEGGTVVITPKSDGSRWTWRETLTVNLRERGPVTLLFMGMTMVEYTGDGWAFEVTYEPANYGQLAEAAIFYLYGGYWIASGTPDGWLKMTDTNYSEVHPNLVREFTNDDITATGIRVENQDLFCEANTFSGIFDKVDVGMDFVPAEVTGGSGTNSFEATYVRNLKVYLFNRADFRFREGGKFLNATLQNPAAWAGTAGDQAEEAVHYDLGADFNTTVFVSPKIEDAGEPDTDPADDTNDIGYYLRDSLATPPLVLNPFDEAGVDRLVERDAEHKRLPALKVDPDGHARIRDLGRGDQEARFRSGGVQFPAQSLLGSGSIEPTTEGQVVYHDGTGDPPAGLYRADPENSQWINIEDSSVTVED